MGIRGSLYNTGFRRSRLTRRVRRLLATDLALAVGEELLRRAEFLVLDVTLAQEGADCSFISQLAQGISLSALPAR